MSEPVLGSFGMPPGSGGDDENPEEGATPGPSAAPSTKTPPNPPPQFQLGGRGDGGGNGDGGGAMMRGQVTMAVPRTEDWPAHMPVAKYARFLTGSMGRSSTHYALPPPRNVRTVLSGKKPRLSDLSPLAEQHTRMGLGEVDLPEDAFMDLIENDDEFTMLFAKFVSFLIRYSENLTGTFAVLQQNASLIMYSVGISREQVKAHLKHKNTSLPRNPAFVNFIRV